MPSAPAARRARSRRRSARRSASRPAMTAAIGAPSDLFAQAATSGGHTDDQTHGARRIGLGLDDRRAPATRQCLRSHARIVGVDVSSYRGPEGMPYFPGSGRGITRHGLVAACGTHAVGCASSWHPPQGKEPEQIVIQASDYSTPEKLPPCSRGVVTSLDPRCWSEA
jgi:hypothetical protein